MKQQFESLLKSSRDKGVLGVAEFASVYNALLPSQQNWLKRKAGNDFNKYLTSGYFIIIGIVYPDAVIDEINVLTTSGIDFERWNCYAAEYRRINAVLNGVAQIIADETNGLAIAATLSGLTSKVSHVSDYFGHTISHRLIAEIAGLGWRGKNGLIIHNTFSCALRFASIITDTPLTAGKRIDFQCGECTACEEACSFIRNRAKLKDYRENCRKYLINLQKRGLSDEVCGKCIQACFRRSVFSTQFRLDRTDPE